MTPDGAGRRGANRAAKEDAGIPRSQQPDTHRYVPDRTNPGKTVRKDVYTVPKEGGGTKEVIIRNDRNGHAYPDDPTQNRGPHFNPPSGNHYDY